MSANAAQVAARKIRSTKAPSRKLGGSTATGNTVGIGFGGASTFTTQNGVSGGGLFGGGIAAPGAFSFSAPGGPSISFGNTSGTSTPVFGSDTEQDPRADTTGEEAARRNKPFQISSFVDPSILNNSHPATQQASQPGSNASERIPLSALSQPNGLGSLPEGEKSNPFQSGRSQSPATAASFTFGATTSTQSQPAANIFSFMQPPQAAPVETSFRFGTPPLTQDKPANNIFSIGQSSSQAQPMSTGISFGNIMAPQNHSSNPFTFGQTSSQSTPPSSGINFGFTPAVTKPTNLFGQPTNAASPAQTTFFGQSNQQALPPATNLFSNLKTQNASSNGLFNVQNQRQPTASTQNQFGGQPQKPPPTNSIFGGNNQQTTPANSIFGGNAQQSTPTDNTFGGNSQQSAPANNIFGNSTQNPASAPTSNIISAQEDQPAASRNFFQSPKPSNSLFGAQKTSTTPITFGNKDSTTTTSNFFGSLNKAPSTSSNPFGNLNKPISQIDGGDIQTSFKASSESDSPNVNGTPGDSGTMNNVLLVESNQGSNNGTKEVPASPKPAPATLFLNPTSNPDTNFKPNLFGNSFEAPKEEPYILPSIEVDGPLVGENMLSTAQDIELPQPITNNLSSSMKTIEAPEDASQPAPSGMFPSLSQSTPTQPTSTNIFAKASLAQSSASPSKPSSNQSASLANGVSPIQNNELAQLQNYSSEMGEVSDSIIEEKCPPRFSDEQKIQFFAAYRLRALNKGIKNVIDATPLGGDFSPAFHHYLARRDEILDACSTGLRNLKRKRGEIDGQQSSPNKRSKPLELPASDQHVPSKSSPLKTQPVVSNESTEHHVDLQKSEPPATLQARGASPSKIMSLSKGSTTPRAPPSSKTLFGQQPSAALPSPSPSGKRKAEVQITKDNPTEEDVQESGSHKRPVFNVRKPGSQTSSVFQNILDKPTKDSTNPSSPEKKVLSMKKTDSGDKSHSNPFASIPLPVGSLFPAASGLSKAPALSPTRAAFAATSSNQPSSFFGNKSIAATKSNSTTSSDTAPSQSKIFSFGEKTEKSTLFIPKEANAHKGSSTTSTISSNPFASKEAALSSAFSLPTSSSKAFGAKSSSVATFTPFASTITSGLTTPNMFVSKPASISAVSNPFVPKLATTITGSASSSNESNKAIKPPTFGSGPVNFLEQFGQKSKKSMADAEKEALEKAKEEDMDSDDDEAEFESNWKKKREAEKKATEELVKNKKAAFVPGKGFTFTPLGKSSEPTQSAPKSSFDQTNILPEKSPEISQSGAKSVFGQSDTAVSTKSTFGQNSAANLSAPKLIFGQNNISNSSATSLFPPINRSGTSSPGAASSRASSVFEGAKPASLGVNNIFGHLSDPDSGAESGKGNDADDDNTTDGETEDSTEERDDEKEDATYDPKKDKVAVAGTPGTPVEETGAGIASAKKNLFNFGSSNSGTSTPGTPGGSLFDRISKDPNGNPIRQIANDDKENAGPSTANIFGGDGSNLFAKYAKKTTTDATKSPQDNTWKQDSPIKFGSSTSAPSVEVTAPTPTKASPFTGLFGSTAPKSSTPTPIGTPFTGFGTPKPSSPAPTSASPFAGLFGNTSAPKQASSLFASLNSDSKPPTVGFNFGGPSTTTSSLFPSAAGSTTTSRATTPGGTTDGESTNEANGDPETEVHEQIDLTSGGPGEENEQVLYTVRAKAMKFEVSKDSGKTEWVVNGLGPLRVLKNKETGAARVLLRADPRGTIVLNKGILGNVTYEATGKTLKLLTAGEGGQGLETWLIQTKTPEAAQELAMTLEENKRRS